MIPLSINCWPSENDSGGIDVNIEYELEKEDMELNQVLIQIPLPPGSGAPVVHECEGESIFLSVPYYNRVVGQGYGLMACFNSFCEDS